MRTSKLILKKMKKYNFISTICALSLGGCLCTPRLDTIIPQFQNIPTIFINKKHIKYDNVLDTMPSIAEQEKRLKNKTIAQLIHETDPSLPS